MATDPLFNSVEFETGGQPTNAEFEHYGSDLADFLDEPDDPVDAESESAALRVQDLYRFYDAEDALLYIGISLHAAVRAMQHRRHQSWWLNVARMDVKHLAECSRMQAELIERECIRAERPIYNVTHNGWHQAGEPPTYETIQAARLDVSERGDWRWPTHPPAGMPTIAFPLMELRKATIAVYGETSMALKASVRAQLPVMRDPKLESKNDNTYHEFVASNQAAFLAALRGGPGLGSVTSTEERSEDEGEGD